MSERERTQLARLLGKLEVSLSEANVEEDGQR
jgi:hypothetical protein